MLRDLGFGEKRSQRLVDISQVFLSDPPVAERPRPSRGSTTALFFTGDGAVKFKPVPYPPTPISHIPGCGPYALDSYRIFCTGGEGWKAVRPTDKELIKYLVSFPTFSQPTICPPACSIVYSNSNGAGQLKPTGNGTHSTVPGSP